ncbi:DEAD/DEAH box helicase [Candidatus Woesearchaeota archaeon]|jgi:superfamily II RNA helicase|nr:DEAD/DEAH box helicase [Candidatus Woesearchaeota archaeon]MBT5272603.1 DEAD/DEAH box helicase [Candidatus Woesearchaeota archaeon]MBT6040540.1 DEAD/DEAH box helicase [Candidatus Woesearchaeota archaeon]MBT6337155.1 DEAD/DEAH box helicase [Candidatus Woesearchaeota archaeon]MBT7927825.1 DEAD/DEAH box helicase [Candidatus Woesearchaeota archaeon]
MQFMNFTLDKFQEEAVNAIDKNKSVLVSAPTGSGKTLIADYAIDKALKGNKRIIYTAPIKALSNQKYKDFTEQYGADKIGLMTGDIVINTEAQVLIMTTEVYRNMAIIKDPMLDDVLYCIMDEIHFISDVERGHVWEESIIFSDNKTRFIFLSATIPNSVEFASWVGKIKKHKVEIIRYDHRPVPLKIVFYDTDLGITTLDKIKEQKKLDKYPRYGHSRKRQRFAQKIEPPNYVDVVQDLKHKDKLPCIFFVFSRKKTQDYAFKLAKKYNYLTEEEKKELSSIVSAEFIKISAEVASLNSTKTLRQCLGKGVAFHHAGLLPDVKHVVEKLFAKGLLKVLFATETFAVGINMPAKTVCFDGLRKYTGTGFRYLNSKEFFQISGRAGRRGMDKEGLSISLIHRRSADIEKIKEFTEKDILPLKSQFRISYNTVLNMINLHNEKEIEQILMKNFFTFQELGKRASGTYVLRQIKARYERLVRTLRKLGYTNKNGLTELGLFTSKIYSDELEVSQLFAADFDFKFDEYTILLAIGALVYEERKGTTFYNLFPSQKLSKLAIAIKNHPILKKGKWSKNINNMSAIVQPCFEQKSFITILKNTNMLEGDLIRIMMQMLDKLEQLERASMDHNFTALVRNSKYLVRESLKGIHIF